jgi:Xaa-Pro dipeptidase
MMEACRDNGARRRSESKVYASMMETMVANGGEDPTLFLWAAGAMPPQHPFVLPQHRDLEAGDTIICEIHPKYAGYTTHIERTFSLGKPDPKRQAIYDGCIAAYEAGLALMGPGKCISEAVYAAGKAVEDRGLKLCELGIHGHGLGSLEHPRFRLHALKADQIAIKTIGDSFVPGMVFAFNIDLFDPELERRRNRHGLRRNRPHHGDGRAAHALLRHAPATVAARLAAQDRDGKRSGRTQTPARHREDRHS